MLASVASRSPQASTMRMAWSMPVRRWVRRRCATHSSGLPIGLSEHSWITTGNQDATVHIWRARDGDELTIAGYPDKVTCLAFDPTGRYLANDGAPDVTVWDFAGKGPNGTSPRLLAADRLGVITLRNT